MQSICWTTRYLSRALRSGFSTLIEPKAATAQPRFVSVACGFPKDFQRAKYKLGKFGDDAWFSAQINSADVIGECGTICCERVVVVVMVMMPTTTSAFTSLHIFCTSSSSYLFTISSYKFLITIDLFFTVNTYKFVFKVHFSVKLYLCNFFCFALARLAFKSDAI